MAKSAPKLPKRVEFHYTPSPEHRTVYVDGVRGVISPRQALRATFFSEHQTLPDTDIHGIIPTQDGQRFGIAEAAVADVPDVFQIDREEQVTLVFTRKGLADLIPWLNTKLEEMLQMEQADTQAPEGEVTP